ncbi:hypothetical protein OVN84_10665, partial [Streptococcus pneumoniae]|nr:hypothetical protein [Streptococcus pneumoniae]
MSRDAHSGDRGLTRRETVVGLAGLGLAAGRAVAQEAAQATGIVYATDVTGVDRSPLPGVLVSNGREIDR